MTDSKKFIPKNRQEFIETQFANEMRHLNMVDSILELQKAETCPVCGRSIYQHTKEQAKKCLKIFNKELAYEGVKVIDG